MALRPSREKKKKKNMDTVHAFLKGAKLANKGQYERFEIREIPKFTQVSELKTFLLTNYEEEISPANDTAFRVGFFGEGRTKCDIKNEKQLRDAYRSVKKGWITLWVDPHSTFKRNEERRESRVPAKKKRTSGICLSF